MRIEDSVKVYRILIHTKINLLEFSYKTPNCIISTKSGVVHSTLVRRPQINRVISYVH